MKCKQCPAAVVGTFNGDTAAVCSVVHQEQWDYRGTLEDLAKWLERECPIDDERLAWLAEVEQE